LYRTAVRPSTLISPEDGKTAVLQKAQNRLLHGGNNMGWQRSQTPRAKEVEFR
jgi:hypothetical protein